MVRYLRERLRMAEQEIERLRGALRGFVYKMETGVWETALDIARHALKKSRWYYPHPIEGEKPGKPEDIR